jgi:hypothetical protein
VEKRKNDEIKELHINITYLQRQHSTCHKKSLLILRSVMCKLQSLDRSNPVVLNDETVLYSVKSQSVLLKIKYPLQVRCDTEVG